MKRSAQRSLNELWSKKKKASEQHEEIELCDGHSSESEEENQQHEVESDQEEALVEQQVHDLGVIGEDNNESQAGEVNHNCMRQCCGDDKRVYQPRGKETLSLFTNKGRKFLSSWYDKYDWLTLCTTQKKVFCIYCRFAHRHKLLTFSKKGEEAFTVRGFDNFKKATEKFRTHANSDSHLESKLKWNALSNPTIQSQLSAQITRAQQSRRAGFLKQLEAMKYLLRQGIALRQGDNEEEGNLPQLLLTLSNDNKDVKNWITEKKYMSHDIVNELISLMGQKVLRQILEKIKSNSPYWYSVIADEATDVACREQFNLSIRHVNDDYVVSEDSIGLFSLPNTKAETLFMVLKDMLTRCNLPLSLCRGQAYDGAATMQGKRKGLAKLVRNEVPAALPVHCLAHSLNLCLQDAGRQVQLLRDTIDLIREIVKLINYSPKRKHLFSEKLLESETSVKGIQPLCPTRWTVRTGAIGAVISQYSIILETMDEIHQTTHDEYGLKAAGIIAALEKFEVFFGLKLGYLLFSAAEETSRVLQNKDRTLQEAVSAVNVTRAFYQRQRNDDQFDRFFSAIVDEAAKMEIGEPKLPRYRKLPARFDDGQPHQFREPNAYFRKIYYEACDLLIQELHDRFEQAHIMKPMIAMEALLVKSANGQCAEEEFQVIQESVFSNDLDFDMLKKHLGVLVDVIHQALPEVKVVTSIRTICEAMRTLAYRSLLSEVHKLLRLYLTVPITSSTSERNFSTLRRVLTYLRATMSEKRLNNCILLHTHKHFTDKLNLLEIAQDFITLHEERKRYFGSFL